MSSRYTKRYAKSLMLLLQPLSVVEQERLLQSAGLSLAACDNPDALVSCSQELLVLRQLMSLSAGDDLALRIGASLTPLSLGAVGYAQMACRSARDAIDIVRRYRSLVIPYMRWDIVIDGGEVIHRLTDVEGMGELSTFMLDIGLALILAQTQALMGDECRPTAINLTHSTLALASCRKADGEDRYREHFGVLPAYSQPVTEIRFPVRYLDIERDSYDPMVKSSMEQLCQSMASRLQKKVDIVHEVKSILTQHATGFPAMAELAASLGVSMRTLRRQLQKHDCSYRDLVDQLRQERAIAALRDSELPLVNIAEDCGFKELHSFYSAFKRWTGRSPASFRLEQVS